MRFKFWKKDTGFFTPSQEGFDGGARPEEPQVEVSEEAKKYNKIVQWVLFVGALLVPLFFLPWTANVLEMNKQLLLIVVAGVGAIVWLLGAVISGQVSFRLMPFDKGVLALLAGTAIVTGFSLARQQSLFGSSANGAESLVTIFALAIFYFLTVNVFDDRGKMLTRALGISALLALAYGLLQMFAVYVGFAGITRSRAFNTIGSVNTLGFFAAAMLPFLSKIKLCVPKLKNFNFSHVGVVLALAVLAILNWWVLWVVAIVGMLSITAMDSLSLSSIPGAKFRIARFLLPMTVTVLGVFLLIVNFNFSFVRAQLPTEISPAYTLAGSITKSVLKERAFFGYGPENFVFAFDKYGAKNLAASSLSSVRFFEGTAQVFSWVVGGGVVMILALLVFLWAVVDGLLKLRKFNVAEAEQDAVGNVFGTTAMLVGLLVGIFLYPFTTTLMFMLFAALGLVALGLWGDRKRTVNIEQNPIVSLGASVGFILGLILVLAGFWFSGIRYYADAQYAFASRETDTNVAIDRLVQARNWYADSRYFRTISQVALKLLSDEIRKPVDAKDTGRAQRINEFMSVARSQAIGAKDINPNEAENWFNLGQVYQSMIGLQNSKDFDKFAEDAFKRALELRPGDPAIPYQAGSMYLTQADLLRQLVVLGRARAADANPLIQDSLNKAGDYFRQATEFSPGFGLAIYNLGAVYDRQGKVAEAIKQMEKIMPANVNQPGLWFELGLLYYRAGRKDDALGAINQAIVIAPKYANAKWYRALLLEERGDLENAKKDLTDLLEDNADNKVLAEKLAQLQGGKTQIPPAKVTDLKPLDTRQTNPVTP